MDPLSLTASLLAILGAGGAIAKGLNKIRLLKQAPNVLLQLNNEIIDLHLLICAVDELYHQHSDSTRASQHISIFNILLRAKEALLELEQLISYDWTRETDKGIEIRRTVWMNAQKKVAETSSKIRNVRTNLNGAWTVISARDESQRIELKLQQILLDVDYLRQGHTENQALLNQTASDLSNQGQLLQVLQRNQRCLEGTTLPNTSGNDSENNGREVAASRADHHTVTSLPGHSNLIHLRLARCRRCKPGCPCCCHRKSFFKSPYAWKRAIGSLFIGYAALPMIAGSCDTIGCQSRLVIDFQALYIFPFWLISGAVHMTIELAKTRGPELVLRYLRIRPLESQFFQSALMADNFYSMNLIAAGAGSVLDVDQDGHSVLMIVLSRILKTKRLYSSVIELLKNILREGADVCQENNFMETPYLFTWRYFLTKSVHTNECEVIDQIINTADPSEILGFNDLHSSIAGSRASYLDFEHQLQQTTRQMIDSKDKSGRTALSWAVELGDLEMIKKLLVKGADPNIADNSGCIPLFYCVSTVKLLRTLLDAGTDVNHINRRGRTKMQALILARAGLDLVELLWSYGADIHRQEPILGYTPLHFAIIYSVPHIVYWLLQKGANIEACTNEMLTPFLLGLRVTSSPIITDLLLNRSANYRKLDRYGEGLLHHVARSGVMAQIAILQRAGLSSLNVNQKSKKGYIYYRGYCSESVTAMNIAERRRDDNQQWAIDNLQPADPDPKSWFAAFQALIDSIQASDTAEQFGDFWKGCIEDQDNSLQHGDGMCEEENINADGDCLLGLPGSYPNE